MKRPLLGVFFVFSLGILAEEFLDIPIFYLSVYALIFLLLSLFLIDSGKKFLLSAALCFTFLGALTFKNYNSFPENHIKNIIYVSHDLPKQTVVHGKIINFPEERLGYYRQKKSKFLLSVKTVRVNKKWETCDGILSVNVFNPLFNFRYADEVVLEGGLLSSRPATNPGQFDYKKFLERKKIFYVLNVKENNFTKITAHSRINPIRLTAHNASRKTEALIDSLMPEPEGAVLKAVLLGKRQDIDDDTNEDFIKTGTVHVLAISGLHVGLLASIFIILFKLSRLPFKLWVWPLGSLLIFYCIMVDCRPPVMRSTIMILVFLFGRVLKREQDLLNSLVFSAFMILFLNPQDLFDIGFQLSFLTVGSIIYFTPRLGEPFFKKGKSRPYLASALIVSLCAWMVSAPFIAQHFNIFSPITVIANLFVVPWMFFVLAASLIFIFFGSFSYGLGLVFSETAALSITILLKMVSLFSKIPYSYFRVKSPGWCLIIGFYVFILLFFNRKYFKIRAKYFLVATLLVFNILVWRSLFFNEEKFLRIAFLDVGKGDSIFLEFPNGANMLIDGGEARDVDMGRLVVGRFLGYRGIDNIDAVVVTHPHADHVGGVVSVLKNFRVKSFIENGDEEENPFYLECQKLIRSKGVKRFIVKEGDRVEGLGETEICVLNPPVIKFPDLNDNSLVLRLRYKDFTALFGADVKEAGAKNLVLYKNEKLASKVLKVPHHGGSLGDITADFLGKVEPEIAVISTRGRMINRPILFTLNKLGVMIYRTDIGGAVQLTTDGVCYTVDYIKNN